MNKTVFVLEDDDVLRIQLVDGLRARGFAVIEASSVGHAGECIGNAGEIDVAVLDIQMRGESKTGLDVGVELKRRRADWPPEFVVYSAHDYPHYYQNAIALGAAAYLQKRVCGVGEVAAHVRALALRRALHSDRPYMAEQLEKIATESESREAAVEGFCRNILAGELAGVFGDAFVLILTYGGRTVAIRNHNGDMPTSLLRRVQQAVHSRLGAPVTVDSDDPDWLRGMVAHEHESALVGLRKFHRAAFVALGDTKMFRLSLGILPDRRVDTSPQDQIEILDRYLQRPVIRHLLELTDAWSRLELERQKNQVLLKATSEFCFYQGQELSTLLFDAEKSGTEGGAFRKVRIIAEEMRDAGELLTYFPRHGESNGVEPQPVDMADLVGRVWSDDVSHRLRINDAGFLHVEGHCVASEYPLRAERAVIQILGWLGRRLARLQPQEADGLFVRCSTSNGPRVKIVFEERSSRRVPIQLRETLFKPFYESGMSDSPDEVPDKGRLLGLYLAHTLADLAGGALLDASDAIEGSRGHRFELELPAAHVA